ncbi:hypothetical protein GCM10028857_05650 [Salinarchaeum chitinilyticum]
MTTPPDPASVTADADVLAADLLADGPAREALDVVRSHSWIELVASDRLLDDAEAVIATLAEEELAADWRERIEREARAVEHPAGDHPGLASALHGDAAHLLSFDENLTSATAGVELQGRVSVSVRTPEAFLAVFDAEALYESLDEVPYEGPDRDPRD